MCYKAAPSAPPLLHACNAAAGKSAVTEQPRVLNWLYCAALLLAFTCGATTNVCAALLCFALLSQNWQHECAARAASWHRCFQDPGSAPHGRAGGRYLSPVKTGRCRFWLVLSPLFTCHPPRKDQPKKHEQYTKQASNEEEDEEEERIKEDY